MRRNLFYRGSAGIGSILACWCAICGPNAALPVRAAPVQRSNERPSVDLKELVRQACELSPAIKSAEQSRKAMSHQQTWATLSWVPTGEVKGVVGPAPELRCFDESGQPSTEACVRTNTANVNAFDVAGVQTAIEMRLNIPLYTFEKLGSLRDLATAGMALRTAQVAAARGDLVLQVTRAYWSLKFARAARTMVEGIREQLEQTIDRMENEIDEGEGDATVTDLLRLKTTATELQTEELKSRKLEATMVSALAVLTGQAHDAVHIATNLPDLVIPRPAAVETYLEIAKQQRPESKLATSATDVSDARSAGDYAQLWPNFLIAAIAGVGYASSIDDPNNAFLRNNFNYAQAGAALAIDWKVALGSQIPQYQRAKSEAASVSALAEEGKMGIALHVRKLHADLVEARKRLVVAIEGDSATKQWLDIAVKARQEGKGSAREYTDALFGFFRSQLRRQQSVFDINVAWTELSRAIGKDSC